MKFGLVLTIVALSALACDGVDGAGSEHKHSHEKDSHAHNHAHSHEHSHTETVKQTTTGSQSKSQEAAHDHHHDHHGHVHGLDEFLELLDKYSFGFGKHALEWVISLQPQVTGAPKWAQAAMAVLLISLAPNLLMLVLPFGNAGQFSTFRRLSLAFASGSLLGDAFLHLIPHSLAEVKSKLSGAGGHSHHDIDEEASVRVGLFVLCGILLFLAIERLIRLFGAPHAHSRSHSGGDTASESEDASESSGVELRRRSAAAKQQDAAAPKRGKATATRAKGTRGASKRSAAKGGDNEQSSKLTIAAVLNLIADISHNFTDGLAIGAAFSANFALGVSTTASMFFHELPHELGDIAILVQGGFSKWRACALQFITAFGAFGGCAFAFVLEGTRFDELILPLTAGGFIYVSTAGVLPELLAANESEEHGAKRARAGSSRLASAFASLVELACALAGIGVMYAMCALEVHSH